MRRRVVITGVGVVSNLGIGAQPFWDGLLQGRVAFAKPTEFDISGFESRLVGEVTGFSAKDYVPKSYRKAVKVMVRDIEIAVGAAKLAVADAGLQTRGTLPEENPGPTTYPSERMGCQIGAGLIASEADELAAALTNARTPGASFDDPAGGFSLRAWGSATGPDGVRGGGHIESLTPLWLLKYLPNMLACHVTIIHGCEGPSNTITCAEASGILSIGESVRVIERGAADMCFSGGAESKLNFMGLMRLSGARRLAPTDDSTIPSSVIRPYDSGATGTLLSEAGGIVVLESKDAAIARGATIYAEVAGFGAGHAQPSHLYSDCGDAPATDTANEGLELAVRRALRDAKLAPDDIDAIVPHACGVACVDRGEAIALRAVFGSRLDDIELVTVTPNVGESMAGQGALLAAAGALVMRHQTLPARVHAGTPGMGMRAGATEARRTKLKHVLVCSSALGGQGAALILSAP